MQIRMQMFEGAHCLTNYFTHCFSGVALRMEGDVAGYVDELIGAPHDEARTATPGNKQTKIK